MLEFRSNYGAIVKFKLANSDVCFHGGLLCLKCQEYIAENGLKTIVTRFSGEQVKGLAKESTTASANETKCNIYL